MRLELNGRPVYVELDSNRDGSRFVGYGHFEDGQYEDLTDEELERLREESDDTINAMWD